MPCKFLKQYKRHGLWSMLCVATTVICGLIMYGSLISKKSTCGLLRNCPEQTKVSPESMTSENCHSVCMSKECILAAQFILGSLNKSANPCENFYNFACGTYDRNLGKNDTSFIIIEMDSLMKTAIKDVLDNVKNDPRNASRKLQLVYESCMNESTYELKAVSSALEFLNMVGIKNWPNLEPDFEFKVPDMAYSLGILAVHSEFAFFNFQNKNISNTSEDGLPILTVHPECSLLYEEDNNETFTNMIETLAFYLDIEEERNETILDEFLGMDNGLLQLYLDHPLGWYKCSWYDASYDCDKNYTSVVIVNCLEESDESLKFVCNILKTVIENMNASDVYSKDHFHIPCNITNYVRSIALYANSSSHRSIANYLALRFFYSHLGDMSSPFRMLLLKDKPPPGRRLMTADILNQMEFCSLWIVDHMYDIFGSLYVPSKISNIDDINEILDECMDTGIEIIHQQEWISEKGQSAIQTTIEMLKKNIWAVKRPIIPSFADESVINYCYEQFQPTGESFFWNVLKMKKQNFIRKMLSQFETCGGFSPFHVGASAGCGMFIEIGFGLLLPPVYQYGNLNAINLAKLGYIAGHEIGHSLLCTFKEEENVDNVTITNSLERRDCFMKQFSEFEMEEIGKKIQANMTNGEDVADNIGLLIAEKILEKYLKRRYGSEDFRLPGLEYSIRQLFYIGNAQNFCSKLNREEAEIQWSENGHSAPKFRMIGMFQNSKGFAKAFNCPEGSYMNPENKCSFFD